MKKNQVAVAVESTVVTPVAPVLPFVVSVVYKGDDGKDVTLTDTLADETVSALKEIVTNATLTDESITAYFEMIVADAFKSEATPFAGESDDVLRDRLFASPRFQLMARAVEMQHKLYPAYTVAVVTRDLSKPKTIEFDVASGQAKGLIESIRSTCGHQSRNIVRKYAEKFGVKLTATERKQISARSFIEQQIGDLSAICEKPRGDQKIEAELSLYRAAREALRDVLKVPANTAAAPFGLALDKPAAPRETPKSAPVANLTKAQIAALGIVA